MRKIPLIPDTWGIPDHQANKVRDALSNKSLSPEDAVQKDLDEIARDIAIIEPDPSDWVWWLGHLLEELEIHAGKHRLIQDYENSLATLVGKIMQRINGGKW